jgi:pyruvate dehydrogenase (quinone)
MGLAARRVTDPDDLDSALDWMLAQTGPSLLDVVTNPDEVAVPPRPTPAQGWGFAIAKSKEALESR